MTSKPNETSRLFAPGAKKAGHIAIAGWYLWAGALILSELVWDHFGFTIAWHFLAAIIGVLLLCFGAILFFRVLYEVIRE